MFKFFFFFLFKYINIIIKDDIINFICPSCYTNELIDSHPTIATFNPERTRTCLKCGLVYNQTLDGWDLK
jgi:uncharacterized Zn finger protein